MRLAMKSMLVTAVVVICLGYHLAEGDSSVISTDEMIAQLERMEHSQESVEIVARVRKHFGRGSPNPPEKFESEHFVNQTRVMTLRSKGRYRIVVAREEVTEKNQPWKDLVEYCTWNGQEARNYATGRDPSNPTQQSCGIANVPPDGVGLMSHLTWLGWWVFQGPFDRGYADILKRKDALPPELRPGGATRWRILDPDDPTSDVVLEAVRINDMIVLRRALRRSFRSIDGCQREDESDLGSFTEVVFGNELADGVVLPNKAVIIGRIFRPDDKQAFWGHASIDLLETNFREVDDADFTLQFAPDAIIADERYSIVYQLGQRLLNVDGRLFETDEPLHGDVGENLAWWLARGKFISE
jgi:hypothetical protein